MIKSIEATGRTEDDAIANALRQLGKNRDDVSVMVLERAKSGFFGFGASPAKIKVTWEEPDPEPVAPPKAVTPPKPVTPPRPAPAPKSAEAPKPAPKPAPRQAAKPAPAPKAAPAPRPAAPKPAPEHERKPAAPATEEDVDKVKTFLAGLFEHMGVEAQADAAIDPETGTVCVELSGERVGALIGRRGETLDAIQHLTNYVINSGSDERTRVNIDAENYRAKRADALTGLAQKTAARVVRYRRNQTLEPMNAYERHVIHTALQEYPGVTTYSTGTEPNRRVVVAFDSATAPRDSYQPRRDERPRRDDRRDSRPPRRDRSGYPSRPSYPSSQAPAPEKPPVDKTVKEWS